MKKSIQLLLICGLLALLVVILKFIPATSASTTSEATTPSSEATSIPVLSLTSEELQSIVVSQGDETVTYLPPVGEEGHWTIVGYPNVPFNTAAIDYRLKQLLTITALRQLNNLDFSTYGLDLPARTITYTLKDGSRQSLLLGAAGLDGNSYYAMTSEDPKTIYLLPDLISSCATTDIAVFADTKISDFDPDAFAIKKLVLSGTDLSPITFTLSKEQNGVTGNYDFTQADYKNLPVSIETFEAIKDALPPVTEGISLLAANVEDLSPYGLETPSLHLVLDYAVGEATNPSLASDSAASTKTLDLTFGKEMEDGTVCFILGKESSTIYLMDSAFLHELKPLLTPFSLCSKYYALPHISQVKTISIDFLTSSTFYNLEVDHDAKKYSCNTIPLEEADFQTLYRKIIGIMADKQLSDASTDTTPICKICYTLKDDRTIHVAFTPSTVSQYYQSYLHGKLLTGTSKKQIDDLEDALFATVSKQTP